MIVVRGGVGGVGVWVIILTDAGVPPQQLMKGVAILQMQEVRSFADTGCVQFCAEDVSHCDLTVSVLSSAGLQYRVCSTVLLISLKFLPGKHKRQRVTEKTVAGTRLQYVTVTLSGRK